ncbi:regulatory protein RecX [Herbiconiux sp. L3-i23]|uniref:regulatory protein RecX n=1 Tax=Herbiconiux sp. L3-i23 TaxID=2905871 RepID=UPI002062A95F|nr:regulatory protein RecX [Herbiconiux sp. L3-i23]BDI22217.1 hypothetical protein L3i23_09930 [Herbiconiux sp. L3-i23]
MTRDDAGEAEWIAPVTYLFGAAPEAATPRETTDENDASPRRRGDIPRSEGVLRHQDNSRHDKASSAESTRRIENVSTAALARRGLSESEVRTRLMDKGFTDEQVAPEVERLRRAGYLDDRRLAEEVIRIEAERKGKGRTAIIAELRRRGIDQDDYADALAELDQESERERAEEIAVRKLGSLRALDPRTAERRLYALLARRGYSGELARNAVGEAMQRYATDVD